MKFIVYKCIVFGILENVGSISLKINDFSKLNFTDVMVLVWYKNSYYINRTSRTGTPRVDVHLWQVVNGGFLSKKSNPLAIIIL